MKRIKPLLLIGSLLCFPLILGAESATVAAAFRSRILITSRELEPRKTDKDTISAYQACKLSSVTGEEDVSGVKTWHFYYTAFLSMNPGNGHTFDLSFSTVGKRTVHNTANKRLDNIGIDQGGIVRGEITISTDNGIVAGANYEVNMLLEAKGGKQSLASTTLTFK